MNDDTATVLAEVLAAIGAYDPLIFTDQHRALFERATAQLPPSVPAGDDVAAVLKSLRHALDLSYRAPAAVGLCEAIEIVEALAATGARAAGGEPTCGEEYWRGFGNGQAEERERLLSSGNAEQDRADLTELIRNGLLEDDGIGAQFRRTDDGLPGDLARWVIGAGWSKPAPSAHGVAGDESAGQATPMDGLKLGHTAVDVLPGSEAGDSNDAAGDATC